MQAELDTHKTRCRGVTYPESYITKYTTSTSSCHLPRVEYRQVYNVYKNSTAWLHTRPAPTHTTPAGRPRGGVPREQKMLEGHLPRVVYHQVYNVY